MTQPRLGQIWASVVFADEQLMTQVWAPDADPSTTFQRPGTFASDLQGHIAQSRYAWGTSRRYPSEWDDIRI